MLQLSLIYDVFLASREMETGEVIVTGSIFFFFCSTISASSDGDSILKWHKDLLVVKVKMSYSAMKLLSPLLSLKELRALKHVDVPDNV